MDVILVLAYWGLGLFHYTWRARQMNFVASHFREWRFISLSCGTVCARSKIVIIIHYNDVIMTTTVSQITRLTILYSSVYSDADQRKHQSSASLAFVRGIHRGPVNSPHKWPVTRKMFPFDDVIMSWRKSYCRSAKTEDLGRGQNVCEFTTSRKLTEELVKCC